MPTYRVRIPVWVEIDTHAESHDHAEVLGVQRIEDMLIDRAPITMLDRVPSIVMSPTVRKLVACDCPCHGIAHLYDECCCTPDCIRGDAAS